MEIGLEAALDSAVVGTLDWPGMVVALSNQASLFSLLVALFSSAALIVMTIQEPAALARAQSDPLPVGPVREGLTTAWLANRPTSHLAMVAAPSQEPLMHRHQFRRGGLSPTDLVALEALRRRVESGRVSEEATPHQRLAFVQWLTERRRIEG
jgi:hypothetical protein